MLKAKIEQTKLADCPACKGKCTDLDRKDPRTGWAMKCGQQCEGLGSLGRDPHSTPFPLRCPTRR